jgi:glycerophosphoryl diester phosphodiesterase
MGDGALSTPAGRPDGAPALVVAHRGAWDPAPQNSLAAFEQAIADGADAVELDVRRTADGQLVVIHDPRVGVRLIARLDHDELRARLGEDRAPALADVLAAVAGRIGVDIELKEDGYVGEAMALIARHLTPDRYVVTSFLDEVLPQVRAAVPEARIGLLLGSGRPSRRLTGRLAAAPADFLAPHLGLARAGLLAWAAARSLPVWVWTVNEPRTLRALLGDPRVAAVITDRTRVAVQAARGLSGPDLPAVA